MPDVVEALAGAGFQPIDPGQAGVIDKFII
jgi:hypothetical protein